MLDNGRQPESIVSNNANQPRYSNINMPFQGAPCGESNANAYAAIARTIPYHRNMRPPLPTDGEITLDHTVSYTRDSQNRITGGTATITASRSGSASDTVRFFLIIGGVRGMTDNDVDTQHFREVTLGPNERNYQVTLDFNAAPGFEIGQAVAYFAQGGLGVETDTDRMGLIPVTPLPPVDVIALGELSPERTNMDATYVLGPREIWVDATKMNPDSPFIADKCARFASTRAGDLSSRDVVDVYAIDITTDRSEYGAGKFEFGPGSDLTISGAGLCVRSSIEDFDEPRTVKLQYVDRKIDPDDDTLTFHIAMGPPPGSEPEPEPEPEVTASISSDIVEAASGTSVPLTYDSDNATTCEATGDWTGDDIGIAGQINVTLSAESGSMTFGIRCFGANNASAEDSVTVRVLESSSGGGSGGGSLSWAMLGVLAAMGVMRRRAVGMK